MELPFLTINGAFLRAVEADSRLDLESFLEQVRGHIAGGALGASGLRFGGVKALFGPILITGRSSSGPVKVPVGVETISHNREEVPPLAIVDHSGPTLDGRIVREIGANVYGWTDIRFRTDDIERLWPRPTAGTMTTSHAGQGEPRPRGRYPLKFNAVMDAMRTHNRDDLISMVEEAMAATFNASRDTCRRARREVLSETALSRNKLRQIPTIDK